MDTAVLDTPLHQAHQLRLRAAVPSASASGPAPASASAPAAPGPTWVYLDDAAAGFRLEPRTRAGVVPALTQSAGEPPFFELPPIIDIDGLPRLFFIAWYIRDSQRHPGAPRLTDDQCAALDLAEHIANDPAFHIEMQFEPGDVQLLNNTTVLHSREAYTDDEDAGRRRHLLRLWLKTPTASTHELLRGGVPRQTGAPA